jgi:hypothetical protein
MQRANIEIPGHEIGIFLFDENIFSKSKNICDRFGELRLNE